MKQLIKGSFLYILSKEPDAVVLKTKTPKGYYFAVFLVVVFFGVIINFIDSEYRSVFLTFTLLMCAFVVLFLYLSSGKEIAIFDQKNKKIFFDGKIRDIETLSAIEIKTYRDTREDTETSFLNLCFFKDERSSILKVNEILNHGKIKEIESVSNMLGVDFLYKSEVLST